MNWIRLFAGGWSYYRRKALRSSWGGPFNGQVGRLSIVTEIFSRTGVVEVFETGTYRGTTTQWFVENTPYRVTTVESSDYQWGYCRARFLLQPRVTVVHGDSRSFLRAVVRDSTRATDTLFVYLDAHWENDLPLREEIAIVFARFPKAVVMVDDFQVPGDDGYGYDDYGASKELTLDYLAPSIKTYGLSCFFPKLPSSEETGAKRGCVVLVRADNWANQFSQFATLRSA